jgi:hypothetical protein
MTTADLAFGRRVRWQGQAAIVMDINYRGALTPRVQIRVMDAPGRPVRWVRLAELEAMDD